jgi:nucleotide-binding universal stress UspA family protein
MASARGVRCQVMQVEQNQPHEAIVDIAVRKNCDLIVMASHRRRGIAAMLLGSVTAKVLARTTIPVLVYH